MARSYALRVPRLPPYGTTVAISANRSAFAAHAPCRTHLFSITTGPGRFRHSVFDFRAGSGQRGRRRHISREPWADFGYVARKWRRSNHHVVRNGKGLHERKADRSSSNLQPPGQFPWGRWRGYLNAGGDGNRVQTGGEG